MKTNTLSNTRRTALHVLAVLVLLAVMLLILSAQTFAASPTKATGKINGSDGVWLRKSSSTGSAAIALLSDNTKVTIYREVYKSKTSTSKSKRWYYVKANGQKGYVRADCVSNVKYAPVSAKITKKVNFRKGPGTRMKMKGSFKKGKKIKVYLDSRPVKSAKGSSKVWYRVKYGKSYVFVSSSCVKITSSAKSMSAEDQIAEALNITSNAFSKMTTQQFENYLTNQGFPEAYKKSLRTLHAKHPNWVFVAYKTGIKWIDAMKKETAYGVSLVYKSYPKSYRSTSKNSFSSYSMNAAASLAPEAGPADPAIGELADEQPAQQDEAVLTEQPEDAIPPDDAAEDALETANEEANEPSLEAVGGMAQNAYYQVEPGWYNASAAVVAYYMDPRNFLNEDRIYMFENLAYQEEYQTSTVVNKIISPTRLPGYGFTYTVFMNAGKKYNISPVFLAARVRQETGGTSASVNGSKYDGTVVYNPFNIGAYGSNPQAAALKYAKKKGWTTPAKAVNGGASHLASGYISKKQNTIYFQRFNMANGLANAGTHQYMTNIMAPYSEAHITKSSYSDLGITNEPLGFIIPIYSNMPAQTKLP